MEERYLMNAWYMAAWQEEVGEEALLARTLLEQPWLLYRTAQGDYAMIHDRCPHRFAPLSRGKRIGDVIACGYHGLRFDRTGKCVHNPFSDRISPKAVVKSLPVVARHGILWFWPGDPEKADPASIPDFTILDDPAPMVRTASLMNAHYELLTDNLLDLSHIEFVHEHSFQSGGALLQGQHKGYIDNEGVVWSCWTVEDTTPPRFAAAQLAGQRVDRWTTMRWNAPSVLYLEVGATPHGVPREESPVRPLRNPHIITPSTHASCYYFYNCIPGAESEAFARRIFEEEDRPMLEAVQQRMGDQEFWSQQPLILNVDAGAIHARQQLIRLKKAEAGEGAREAPAAQ